MLYKYHSRSKTFNFVSESIDPGMNVFSVVVGKNGTGKSRLFKAIIHNILGEPYNQNYKASVYGRHDLSLRIDKNRLGMSNEPARVIAVSTSPFDKFPLPQKQGNNLYLPVHYSYLGLRGVGGFSLGESYMANVITSLMSSVIEDPNKYFAIADVLNYLGYTSRFDMTFRMTPSRNRLDLILSSPHPENKFEEFIHSFSNRNIDKTFFFDRNGKLDLTKVHRILGCLDEYQHLFKKNLRVSLSDKGIVIGKGETLFDNQQTSFDEDILLLMKAGIIRLRDVSLEKYESGQSVRFSEASSGEQAVVMSILGIASRIEHNSIIFIDEPEVCLHPEWQEKYISLLMTTFARYNGCHFIIATHSPQIVSNLRIRNCFVTSMDDGIAIPASELTSRSIDFQLANTFRSPGYKNEYLSREILTLLTKFSMGESVTRQEKLLADELLDLEDTLKDTDPVKRLMGMLRDVLEVQPNA